MLVVTGEKKGGPEEILSTMVEQTQTRDNVAVSKPLANAGDLFTQKKNTTVSILCVRDLGEKNNLVKKNNMTYFFNEQRYFFLNRCRFCHSKATEVFIFLLKLL